MNLRKCNYITMLSPLTFRFTPDKMEHTIREGPGFKCTPPVKHDNESIKIILVYLGT